MPTHPEIDLALGLVHNVKNTVCFGRNSDVDIGTPEDVWEGGGDYTGQPVDFTPETVDVFSSSTADTSAGTGARTIRIYGLKSSTSPDYETEDLVMNGTTAVTSTNTWWRVNKVEVLTAGSGEANAGIITVRSTTTTANVFAGVPAGMNESQIAAYTVPAGKKGVLKRVRCAITRANGSAGSATVSLRVRPPGGVYLGKRVFEMQTGTTTEYMQFGEVFDGGTDIKFRADVISDNNTAVEAAFGFLLVGK